MEIEPIQQIRRLKVERTGSEAERRRHQRPEEDFDELLEQSLNNGHRHGPHDAPSEHGPSSPPPPPEPQTALLSCDTVSLSMHAVAPAVTAPDRVSISAAARVGAQSQQATAGALRLSLVQRTVLGLRGVAAPDAAPAATVATTPEQPPAAAPPAPGSLDTVA